MRGLMVLAAVLAVLPAVAALNNGLAKTPPMGWNSWYDYMCSGFMNETYVIKAADALISNGFVAAGYKHVNLDDCWAGGRFPNGSLFFDPTSFPLSHNDPTYLSRQMHSRNLTFGLYTDRGTKTCGGRSGAFGHEHADGLQYGSWEIDYLKEDSCYASQDHDTAFSEYGKMRDGLNASGRYITFSLCGWNTWYAPVGYSLGNLWRIGPDTTGWKNVLVNINQNAPLSQYAGPGGWNDPCLLISKAFDGKPQGGITELQSRAQFNMWAVMASPLLISSDVINMSSYMKETYLNSEVIAVDQDPLGKQGNRIVGGDLQPASGGEQGPHPAALGACNASDPLQQWAFNKPYPNFISNGASNCLNADDCGQDLIMFPCVPTSSACGKNQEFQLLSSGALQSGMPGNQCVSLSPGNALVLNKCDDTSNVLFAFEKSTGQLRNGSSCLTGRGAGAGQNIWARPLHDGRVAATFLNTDADSATLTCDATCFAKMGFHAGTKVGVRDVWAHKAAGSVDPADGWQAQLQADGGSAMFVFGGNPDTPVTQPK